MSKRATVRWQHPSSDASPSHSNVAGLRDYLARAKALGFTGMFAIHPSHVGDINDGFAVSAAALDRARRIVEAFVRSANTGAR